MRKLKCRSCEAKIDGRPAFCARCGEPTPFASAEERSQHDLEKWHRHRQAAEVAPGGARIPASVRAAPAISLEQPVVVRRRARPEPRPAATMHVRVTHPTVHEHVTRPTKPAREKRSLLRGLRDRAATKRRRVEPMIDLDAENPFAYSACVSCERTDWIVRTGRNEDGSFRYWCLRCSRSFKSDVRLSHAAKPFVVSGSILLALTLLANIRF